VILEPELAAVYAGVRPGTLRVWASRPATGIARQSAGYDTAQIDAYLARRNTRMIRNRCAA